MNEKLSEYLDELSDEEKCQLAGEMLDSVYSTQTNLRTLWEACPSNREEILARFTDWSDDEEE